MSSARNNLMIFERVAPILDRFVEITPTNDEVTKAWCSLEPLTGRELFQAQQVQSQVTHKACCTWTAETTGITTDCRMKLAKPTPVDEQNANADVNFRIFQITSIRNVREQNRELELMVVERT